MDEAKKSAESDRDLDNRELTSVIDEQNAVFCSQLRFACQLTFVESVGKTASAAMTMESLFDSSGKRKYVVAGERNRFVAAALAEGGAIASFCATLAITGARISEVLALTPDRIDIGQRAIIFETLKRRKRGIFRAVPVPRELLLLLEATHHISACLDDMQQRNARLWPCCRTTAWSYVKRVMKGAGVGDAFSKPKALRHGFAIAATQNSVPLNMVQRWLGHARLETTAIYASALGKEESALASRTWRHLQGPLNRHARR